MYSLAMMILSYGESMYLLCIACLLVLIIVCMHVCVCVWLGGGWWVVSGWVVGWMCVCACACVCVCVWTLLIKLCGLISRNHGSDEQALVVVFCDGQFIFDLSLFRILHEWNPICGR